MKELLEMQYGIHGVYTVEISGRKILTDGEYVYLIITADNKEVMYMEQAALSSLLYQNGCASISRFMPNRQGEWLTAHEGHFYLLMYADYHRQDTTLTDGQMLAQFHEQGTIQQYEPQHISSYGQWKHVWANKLDLYEQHIYHLASEDESRYINILLDTLPYIIGISENAIQYVQESETEWRTNEYDHGTAVFHRYTGQVMDKVIWSHELVFDHGIRDLSGMIRAYWLHDDNQGEEMAVRLINDYMTIRPLSVLAWRALYARLVMPLHLLDIIGEGFFMQNHEEQCENLTDLLAKQPVYEQKLSRFFETHSIDVRTFDLPVIHWL